MFHVGQHVECIANLRKECLPGSANPVLKGNIYTVREVRDDAPWLHGKSSIVLLLHEVSNAHLIGTRHGTWYCYVEPGFRQNRFRPLSSTRLDVFRQLLVSPKERVGA